MMIEENNTTSVYNLVNNLCELLCREYFPVETKIEISARRLKSRAYEILLKKSLKPIEISEHFNDPLRELDVKQFEYRIEARLNPEQQRLCEKFSECLNFIQEESYFKTETAKAVLTFLIALSDASRTVEDGSQQLHESLLIPGPFTLHANYSAISHYPPAINKTTNLEPSFKSFQLMKNYQNLLYEPQYKFIEEIKSIGKVDSAFSIQTNPQKKSSTVSFNNYQETWKCGLNINPSQCRFFNATSYGTPSPLSSTKSDMIKKSSSTVFRSATSTSDAVTIPETTRLTFNWNWESMGQIVPVAPSFVTETNNSVLHLHGARAHTTGFSFEAKVVRFDRFLNDLKNVTIGIQSDSFQYDNLLIFHMDRMITIDDISPFVMEKFILPFIESGTCYKRLQLMIAKKNLPFLFDGFIFKATCGAIEEYLKKFRQYVVLFEDHTLLSFYKRMKKMMKQISYLAYIFAIHPNVDADVRPPMGSQFLSYLYKEITNATQKDIIMLLVYILKQCCYAYFKYLQKWIFHGELDDPRNELFICFVDHYRVNTKYFYDKAYYVRKESVPGFLQGFEDQILQCGKYTMLLKAFNPAHPIFSVDCPSISVCLSFKDVQKMEDSCRNYIKKAQEICGKRLSPGDIFEERREARKKFKEMVLEKSLLNLEKWTVGCETQAAEETARKRKRLEELQEHLKAVRDRKIADKKNEIILERKILKEAQEIEDKKIAEENLEIQKRIEYYQQLNAIIEERKARNDVTATVSNSKIDTDPETPSSVTDFESCLGEDEHYFDEELKSLYEDASTSADFVEKFLETEKKLNEYLEVTNNNKAEDGEIKRSASDVLNQNEVSHSEFHTNRSKILGSTLTNFIRDDSEVKKMTTGSTVTLTEAQKIKLKVLSSEFGIDTNSNEDTPSESTSTTLGTVKSKEISDLEVNRRKMMQNDLFANLNAPIERKMLQLDLNTERSRNRRRVLESEYNILTGVASANSTPMSTTSDSPIVDDHEEDVKNANVLKLIVPPRPVNKWNTLKTPEVDLPTAATIEETPECGLNTAGVMAKKGFQFQKNDPDKSTVPNIIDLDSKDLPSSRSSVFLPTPDEQSYQVYNPQFKWKLVSEILSLDRVKSCKGINFSNTKNVNDLNVITLTEFLQKSVIVPLRAHLEIMNSEIMGLYLKELDILGHFKSLRNYFFLMDGEFGSIVCDGLISKLENGATPNELLSYRMLHTILDNALGSSNSGNDKNAESLSFIVGELPEKFDMRSPDVLQTLSLSYRVSWPLNLILSPETLDRYSNIFKYLIKVRRISWVLEEAYQKLKEIVKKNGKEMLRSPQYRRIQQIRHKFFHFIHALNNHITSNALQASWKTFKDDLVSAKSIEDIYRKHTTYIKRILFLCMLNKKSVEFYNSIENIFKVTLRFSKHLKSREWKCGADEEFYTHPRYEKILADEEDFEKAIKYTIYLGNKIVRRGYQEEIGEFINLINFNQYYLVDMCN